MNLYYLWNKLHKLFVYIICIEKFFTIIFGGLIMKNKKMLFLLLMTFFIFILGLSTEVSVVKAVTPPTKTEVYENAPDGLSLEGLIDNPDYDGGTNGATLLTDFPTNIVEMLSANKPNNQISSFWGKKYSDTANTKLYNSFRLDKPQTISAWLYFGDTYHFYSDKQGSKEDLYDDKVNEDLTSDGMALVLQDDDRGAKAISTALDGTGKGKPSYGETLGVWAGSSVDHSPLIATGGSLLSPPAADLFDNLYTTGIQKSFAFEMDAVQNYKKPKSVIDGLIFEKVEGTDDYFDASSDYKGQHLTTGYPGDKDTYISGMGKYNGNKGYYYFSQKYQAGTSNNIEVSGYATPSSTDTNVDKAWRHLTFNYIPPATADSNMASFKYSFNDQKIDGTATAFNIKSSGSGSIDLSKVSKNDNIRWGFTASTGSKYSAAKDYAIIMQQMPNTANVENTAKLYDMSQYDSNGELGREISDLNQNGQYNPTLDNTLATFSKRAAYNVSNNDKLLFQYDLKYDSGTMNTGDIKAVLHLPKKIDFKTGLSSTIGDQSIGKVVYSGAGSDASKSFEISPSDITTDAKSGDQVLNMNLADMDTEGQKATIYLYGQANVTITPQIVDGEPISYRAQNYISDVTTPVFIINDQLQISDDKVDQTVASNEDVTLNGKINYVNNSAFDSKAVQIHTTINGEKIDTATANTTSGSTTGDYMMVATNALSEGSLLKIGTNKIEVYATDSLNRVSNKITYTITVKDYKDLLLTATGDNPQTVKATDTIVLTNDFSYSNGDTVNLGNLSGSYKIDNDENYTKITPSKGDAEATVGHLTFKLPAGTLSPGKHTIKLYITDVDGRNSNEITYDIIVVSGDLVLTPTDLNQTVHDNSDVKLTGKYGYSDNSDFTNKVTTVKYQITDADGNKQAEVTQNVTDKIVNESEFTIELKPIGAELFDNNSQQSVEDYLKEATGLKVGRNQIDVTAYDGETASNTVTYVVDVPDIAPTIEATKTDLTAISNLAVRLPMTFTYPDVNAMAYQLQANDLAVFAQISDSSDTPVMTVADRPKQADGKVTTPYKLNPKSTWTDDLAEGDYHLNAYVMDRYLRKTNTVEYAVEVLPTGAQVEVENYRFKPINPRGNFVPKYVQRDGGWNIKVDSYKSKWKLHAQSDNMKRQDEFGDYSESSNLQMVQLTDNTPISLSENPVVATGDSTGTDEPTSYSLFGENSDPNQGILLGTRGVPLSGEYQSTVTWSINDAL